MSRRYRKRTQRYAYPQITPQLQVIEQMEKSNPAYTSLVTFAGLPQPHMMPKNFKTYAIEGYRGNDTLYKVINYIITNGAAIPPKLYTDDSMQKEIEKHPLLDKLKRPNPEQNGVNYRKAVLGYYLVAGNSFQYAIRKNKAGPPDELWTLEPHKIKILPTRTRGVVGYNYDEFENTDPPKNPIDGADVAHMKAWAPDDPLWGVSPIEVGAVQVDQQLAAKKWNLALLQNSAKMSGAFTTDIIMSPNDRSKVEDRVNEKITGFRNAGRVPVLDGGLKWNAMSVTPQQMDWLPAIQYNAGSLANLYNMPPQLIGDTSASTYENMEQAKAASYTEEIFPVLDELYALWTMWLLPMYPDLQNAFLYYDKESVEVVQTVIQTKKTAIAERAKDAWLSGEITLNECREMQDLPPDPGGDVYRFGNVLVRKAELDTYAEQSLQIPAAPPAAVPENILDMTQTTTQPGGAGGNNNKPPPPKPAGANDDGNVSRPNQPSGSNQPGSDTGKSLALAAPAHAPVIGKANTTTAQKVNYLLWDCVPTACEFCMQNDGAIVVKGEQFPNSVISPEECHEFCMCTAHELAIPADINPDSLVGISADALAAMYGVGFIPSRHDRDVAAQEEEKRKSRADFRRFMEAVL
jgi:HK97 family phage portal protein